MMISTPLICGAVLILMLALVYWKGLAGWAVAAGAAILIWWVSLLDHRFDPALAAVSGIAGSFVLGGAWRWARFHQFWQKRLIRDQQDARDRQDRLKKVIRQMREKITARSAEVDQTLQQYEGVKKCSEAASRKEDLEPLLDQTLASLFGAEGWALYLTDGQGELHLLAERRLSIRLQVEDLVPQSPYWRNGLLGMPFWRRHERIGLLLAQVPEQSVPPASLLARASSFSSLLLFVMMKAKLNLELERQRRLDPITGLVTRGPFEDYLEREMARADLFQTRFSLLRVRVDRFLELRRTYGVAAANDVLRTAAQCLRQSLYDTDRVARWGDDELICLLPGADPEGLKVKADRIVQRVKGHAWVMGLEPVSVTVTLGMAHFPGDGSTAHALLETAGSTLSADSKQRISI